MSDGEKFKDYTDEQLVEYGSRTGIGGHGESKVYGTAADPRYQIEMTRRLTNSIMEVNESIKKFSETTSRYSNVLIVLTGVLLITAVIQIVLLLIK